MDFLAEEHRDAEVLYLSRQDVVRACRRVDVVSTVADTLKAHAKGETILPDEAYLSWETADGAAARSLAMPGGIRADGRQVLGLKVINASLANPVRGLPRAQGFTCVFDPETARPLVIMESAYISSLRTAAVTAVAAEHLGRPGSSVLALIGCGTLAKAHLVLLPAVLEGLRKVRLYDQVPARAEALAAAVRADPSMVHLDVEVTVGPEECVRGADFVTPVTTVTEGYIPRSWLQPGALVAHVSLDDVLPDVVRGADLVLVDDWALVSNDRRRLLGRMYQSGELLAPDGNHHPQTVPSAGARRVDGTLGEVLLGMRPGRRSDADIVLSNPFGMSILDVAVAGEVHRVAVERGLGIRIPV